jgi:tRNA modification GTPase
MDLETTIVAVSSPSGNSARSFIRATGKNLFRSVEQIGIPYMLRRITCCTLSILEGELPVLILAFPSSSSCTGQDTIEIELPNNEFLVKSVLRTLIEVTSGRYAEAGEFTARAFFNGKMSLSEAEGICATISASNDGELRGATLLRCGTLNTVVSSISEKLVKCLALVEAGIDFTDEEDVVAISDEELFESIQNATESIQFIVDGRITMATLKYLPHVVISGPPNVGKSTLFNALLGRTRVVVSEIVGTTRDAIHEPVWFGDKEAMLIDIAGLEDTVNQISKSAQLTAHKMIEQADLVLWCVAPDDGDPKMKKNTIVVHTKSDLQSDGDGHNVCAVTGDGIELLKRDIEQQLFLVPIPSEDAIALLPRHEEHLQDALCALQLAERNCIVRELAAASLRDALNAIGSISGNVTPDDVIGEVFSSFCIGK